MASCGDAYPGPGQPQLLLSGDSLSTAVIEFSRVGLTGCRLDSANQTITTPDLLFLPEPPSKRCFWARSNFKFVVAEERGEDTPRFTGEYAIHLWFSTQSRILIYESKFCFLDTLDAVNFAQNP